MTFNSLSYALFLPVVYLAFQFAGDRFRWMVLLAASLAFYAALRAPYLLVALLVVGSTSYLFALLMRDRTAAARRWLLWGAFSVDLLVLAAMRYLPLLQRHVQVPFAPAEALVAIGVSYYVFQAISYLSDVYLKVVEPERHFGHLLLYLAFFPKLAQGPIERAADLLPQLKARYSFDYDRARASLLLFAFGLFKKEVLADRIGIYVDTVYNDVHAYAGLPLVLATYGYAVQIYLDFSGYTDMALASAALFNIRLTQNFNSPYLATSVADFWRRWHISFSRFIMDYIYMPLQMQWRYWKKWGTAAALAVAFLASGIWHGASWGFVIWGALHALYLASSVFYRPYQQKLHKALGMEKSALLKLWQMSVTFNLVSFAWIFFRAATLSDALYVAGGIFADSKGSLAIDNVDIAVLLAGLATLVLVSRSERKFSVTQLRLPLRWAVYLALIICIIGFGVFDDVKFIYNRF